MADPMTEARLDEISALADAATPGPWEAHDSENSWSLHMAGFPFQILKAPKRNTPYAEYWPNEADAAFIVASRQDMADLLAEVRRARAAEEAARTEHADMRLRLDQANDAAYGMSRAKEVRRIQAIETENAGIKRLLAEAATEIDWAAEVLSEHHLHEDGVADIRGLADRLRALLAKEA